MSLVGSLGPARRAGARQAEGEAVGAARASARQTHCSAARRTGIGIGASGCGVLRPQEGPLQGIGVAGCGRDAFFAGGEASAGPPM